MFLQALKLIEKYDRIVVHRHTHPDGDAIGSQTGLKELLQLNYPQKKIYAVGDNPGRYGFVEGSAPQEIADEAYDGALAIVLDCGGSGLVSDDRYKLAAATLRFDHHLFAEQFCDVEIVDTSFESCCGLIAQFATECGWKWNKRAATAIFTGMVTDSGRFRYDSTTARTLKLAAMLLEQGVDTSEVYVPLYAESYASAKLRAQYVLKIQFTPNGAACIYTTKEELASLGVSEFTISRGMVGVMNDLEGVKASVNFTETDKGVLCELRSATLNINRIAVKYGGGGHLKASGATVADRETAMQMLNDLDKLCKGEDI